MVKRMCFTQGSRRHFKVGGAQQGWAQEKMGNDREEQRQIECKRVLADMGTGR